MASPEVSAKPDLGSLRIHDGQRSQSRMGKRVLYASIPVVIFAGIVAAAYAFRSQKPVVEVTAAAKADAGDWLILAREGNFWPSVKDGLTLILVFIMIKS